VDPKEIIKKVGGRSKINYKFRDWLISRQRYWGAPIPIVYDPQGVPHPIPAEHLPWFLPIDADIKPKGTSPLGSSKELKERTETIFGKGWTPETDTMDGFVDNSWYFLRYLDPKNEQEFSSLTKQKLWMPVTRYSGGAEHTTVHVLYSRFFLKALFDMGLTTEKEPYTVRLNRGIILAEDGRKMSKRWGNVVNPDEQVANVGADAVRTYLAFIGPYNEVGSFPWSTNGLVGVRRFLERVYTLAEKIGTSDVHRVSNVQRLLHQTIKKVGDDIESMKFNTSVSALMILSNELGKLTIVPKDAYETLLKLLAPFAPHITEELWKKLGHTTSVHLEPWPSYDLQKLHGGEVTVAIQIGGKTRGTVTVPRGASENEVLAAVRNNKKLNKLAVESPKRVIFVPDRILNLIP
jgi:leucyl-tRNA synthetase